MQREWKTNFLSWTTMMITKTCYFVSLTTSMELKLITQMLTHMRSNKRSEVAGTMMKIMVIMMIWRSQKNRISVSMLRNLNFYWTHIKSFKKNDVRQAEKKTIWTKITSYMESKGHAGLTGNICEIKFKNMKAQ
ncbi:uncharacterized protein LOC124199726 [Daphnia pulex]|uniref:uncharacterized protein LOC124199726 n=1 Tax=Daphnia pulex TaxID=6669 RepID=UPI001EDFDC24|nr:uncharacterized protein LOC124199726 [Daphnia pulex]